ncbi:MAG: XRE family transcriptional regulator [Anaerolineaceae bacterium]|nr:MAG: XRE family transcriptional regulator [Anaerolineaceae bacterium]
MENSMKVLGRHIRALRKSRGLKAKDIAERANLTPTYISRVENGRVDGVSVEVIMRIAQAMSVPTAALFKDDEIVEELIKHAELMKKFFKEEGKKDK